MEFLLITTDSLLRDQLKVGLQQFPEFGITCGESFPGINMVRTMDFDLVFMEIGSNSPENLTLVNLLRSFDTNTEVVALADDQVIKDLSPHKQKHGITAFLSIPLNVTEFFRLISRMRARREEADTAPTR